MIQLSKKSNKRAQVITEYSTMIICVIMGIVVMGPYVIRSWNAHVKGWEDSVQDSFSDQFPEDPPIIFDECTCEDFENVGCGLGQSIVQCSEGEMLQVRPCSPQSCIPGDGSSTARCVLDDSCCTWEDGLCGSDVKSGPPCPEGYIQKIGTCGTGTEYKCEPDPRCGFACQGSLDPNDEGKIYQKCPGDEENLNNSDTGWKAVSTGGCSNPRKCEFECLPPYVPSVGKFRCILEKCCCEL